jgi:hypothetical protein
VIKHLFILLAFLAISHGAALAQPSISGGPLPATQCVSTAVASGTPDAMVIPSLPCADTTTLLILTAIGANARPSPTLQVTGTMNKYPIVNIDLTPAGAGAIPAAGYRLLLTFDGSHWIILNTLTSTLFPFNQNGSAFLSTSNFTGSAIAANKMVLGSSALPNGTQDPILAVEKFSNSTATSGVNQAMYVSAIKSTNLPNSRLTSAFFETQDISGWNSAPPNVSFIEGLRSHALLVPPETLGSAYGGVFSAMESGGATHTYLVGAEAEVISKDADAPLIFNPFRFSASFVATSTGDKKPDAAFLVNPFLGNGPGTGGFQRGFYVPAGAGAAATPVIDSAFAAACACTFGLNLVNMPATTFASIMLPNTAPIRIKNGSFSADVGVLNLSSSNVLAIGNDSHVAAVTLGMSSAPTNILGGLRLATSAATNLPGCNAGLEGSLYGVTDALSAVFNTVVVGGGGNHVMAYCNGAAWTVH